MIKKVKGGIFDGFKYWWEPLSRDRGRLQKVPKLKRSSVHYVLGTRVSRPKWWNTLVYRALDGLDKNLRRK